MAVVMVVLVVPVTCLSRSGRHRENDAYYEDYKEKLHGCSLEPNIELSASLKWAFQLSSGSRAVNMISTS